MDEIKEYLDPDWKVNRNRILLFADIMGFKTMIADSDHSILVKQFRDFINQLTKLLEPFQTGRHIRMTIFSDSIIIGADSCTIKNFNLIVKAAASLMFVCHKFKWPVNGSISCGSLTFDDFSWSKNEIKVAKNKRKILLDMPLFIGDSVVKSHLLNEELFCYGIVLHPSAEPLLNISTLHKEEKFHHPFYFTPIPLKSGGFARMHYLDWTSVPTGANLKHVNRENVLYQLLDLEKITSQRVRAYIHNTREILSQIQDI